MELSETVARDSASWAQPAIPAAAAIAYPWVLQAFHASVTAGAGPVAVGWLVLAFALPLGCLALTTLARAPLPGLGAITPATRRLALAALAAPPLFVLAGVVTGLVHSPVRDIWIWPVAWIAAGAAATRTAHDAPDAPASGGLRVAHGISAALILLFVAFHLSNHVTGLLGAEAHGRLMKVGRVAYRSPFVEPVLVGLLLFQVGSGLRLAWRWTSRPVEFVRAIQVGSGVYLAAFILTHLNSALVGARAVRGIETDWAWATGAPEGLLLDGWNIRLAPHYALGVFFVVAHLSCGLRQVLLAHGLRRAVANRIWALGLLGAAALSAAITAALCGARIGA